MVGINLADVLLLSLPCRNMRVHVHLYMDSVYSKPRLKSIVNLGMFNASLILFVCAPLSSHKCHYIHMHMCVLYITSQYF